MKIANVNTEKKAKSYLVGLGVGFHECSLEVRKAIALELGGDLVFKNSFDLVRLPEQMPSPIVKLDKEQMRRVVLVELKSSARNMPAGFKGYYFSTQQREIDLAGKAGGRMVFAFVAIPSSGERPHHEIYSWGDVLEKTKRMRTQVNINF